MNGNLKDEYNIPKTGKSSNAAEVYDRSGSDGLYSVVGSQIIAINGHF